MSKKVSRCGVTRKVGFKSHEAALIRGGEILSSPNARASEFRAYQCVFCGLWHLTSKD